MYAASSPVRTAISEIINAEEPNIDSPLTPDAQPLLPQLGAQLNISSLHNRCDTSMPDRSWNVVNLEAHDLTWTIPRPQRDIPQSDKGQMMYSRLLPTQRN